MDWFMTAVKKYAVFSGRSRRSEYWYFVLFYLLISIGLSLVEGVIGTGGVLGGIFSLALFVPSLAVGVRRLHDTDRSGWWLLIGLIPLIGAIVLIVFFVQEGTAGDNRFGSDPKAGAI